MPRVKSSVASHRRKKKIFSNVKGFWGRRKNLVRTATEANERSLAYAYVGRKLKKRDFRQLWIVRINAACRQNGLSYSKFIGALKEMNVKVNRKMLAEIAVKDPMAFTNLAEQAKEVLK